MSELPHDRRRGGCEALAARGLRISERTLRARATAAGACLKLGSQMIILPEHIDQLFEAPECRSKSTSATASSGFEADLLMAVDGYPSLDDLTPAALRRVRQ